MMIGKNLYLSRDLDDRGYAVWMGNEPPELDMDESHLYYRRFSSGLRDCFLLCRIEREPTFEAISGQHLEEGQCIRIQRLVLTPVRGQMREATPENLERVRMIPHIPDAPPNSTTLPKSEWIE